MTSKIYRIKVLDFSYQQDFEQLVFRHLTYEVSAENKKEAVKKARSLYMKGEKKLASEEIPLFLKLYSFA